MEKRITTPTAFRLYAEDRARLRKLAKIWAVSWAEAVRRAIQKTLEQATKKGAR